MNDNDEEDDGPHAAEEWESQEVDVNVEFGGIHNVELNTAVKVPQGSKGKLKLRAAIETLLDAIPVERLHGLDRDYNKVAPQYAVDEKGNLVEVGSVRMTARKKNENKGDADGHRSS